MNMTAWNIEASNCAGETPPALLATNMNHLRQKLQRLADRRRLGELHYRYELDSNHEHAVVVHTYFTGRDNKRWRFIRLRREGTSNASR